MSSLSGLHLRSRLQGRLLRPRLRQIRLLVCDVDALVISFMNSYLLSLSMSRNTCNSSYSSYYY
jgi:hypothetical protein